MSYTTILQRNMAIAAAGGRAEEEEKQEEQEEEEEDDDVAMNSVEIPPLHPSCVGESMHAQIWHKHASSPSSRRPLSPSPYPVSPAPRKKEIRAAKEGGVPPATQTTTDIRSAAHSFPSSPLHPYLEKVQRLRQAIQACTSSQLSTSWPTSGVAVCCVRCR